MDILIRKIQCKGKAFVFKPNSRSGYKFSVDDALPRLTAFQKSCVQTKPQKDRKLGSFWTPNFCYIGMLIVQEGEADLVDMINATGSMKDFNSHFPDKKHYWYEKAKPQNPAMETYFIGVRAVASILGHYHKLQKLGKIKDAAVLYQKYLKPLGLAKLLAEADSSLLSEDDLIYSINFSNRSCMIQTNRQYYSEISIKSSKENNTLSVKEDVVSGSLSISNRRTNKDQDQDKSEDIKGGFLGIKPPKARIKSFSEINNIEIYNSPTDTEYEAKKNPHNLPNITGEK